MYWFVLPGWNKLYLRSKFLFFQLLKYRLFHKDSYKLRQPSNITSE